MRPRNETVLCTVILFFVVFLPATQQQSGPIVDVTKSSTGVMVPLYGYPGPVWNELVNAKQTYPGVPILAIVNPAGGPGAYQDPSFESGVRSLQSVGIVVLGYVYTQQGTRPLSSVEADISSYRSWYGVSGIYFDQMASTPGKESYYSALSAYASMLSLKITVGNAGEASISPSYLGTVGIIVLYENKGVPALSSLQTWQPGHSRDDFAIISYEVANFNASYTAQITAYVHYLYITDASADKAYFVLPSYLDAQLKLLEILAPPAMKIYVNSLSTNGSTLQGVQITLSNATYSQRGTTPALFAVPYGYSYTLSASERSGAYVFQRWSSGVNATYVAVNATSTIELIAYFRPSASNGTTENSTQG